MNAAKRRHALTHTNAVIYLAKNYSDYKWLIDFDFQHLSEDGLKVVRPDICGEKEGKIMVAVEISDSTLNHDLSLKKDFYASADIMYYIIFDCDSRIVYQFELTGTVYRASSDFKFSDDLFQDDYQKD